LRLVTTPQLVAGRSVEGKHVAALLNDGVELLPLSPDEAGVEASAESRSGVCPNDRAPALIKDHRPKDSFSSLLNRAPRC